jgi:hypothetical protein
MAQENDPRVCVDVWIKHSANGKSGQELVQDFQRAFDALWRRAQLTLGDVTLMAIVDRVLHNAVERFPDLSPLTVEPSGLKSDALAKRAETVRSDQLVDAFRFVLVEFLTVLGNLTAEILTRALHAELTRVARDKGNG